MKITHKLFALSTMFILLICGPVLGKDCLDPIRSSLASGGYTGGLDCNNIVVNIDKVGSLTSEGKIYIIYNLTYKTKSISPHGGQRLVIINRLGRYIGQYSLDTPPFHRFSINGSAIETNDPREYGNIIRFGKDGPPAHAYIGRVSIDLYK